MATRQYIGARYVPLFADPAEWDNTRTYEPLTIVLYQGASYTSKQAVPIGKDINDEEFWALTGNYNAQVEAYRREVAQFDGRINAADLNATEAKADAQEAKDATTAEATAREEADAALQESINAQSGTFMQQLAQTNSRLQGEATMRQNADAQLQDAIDAVEALAGENSAHIDNLHIFNVLDYGADRTGITDSSDAVQAAILAAKNDSGGVVYFPNGNYLVNRAQRVYEGMTILGTRGTKIEKRTSDAIFNIYLDDENPTAHNITFRNLYLTGNVEGTNTTGIWGQQDPRSTAGNAITGLLIEDCIFRDLSGAGVHFHSGNVGEGFAHPFIEATVLNSRFLYCGTIGFCNSGTRPTAINCDFRACGNEGMTVDNGCMHAIVSNCKFVGNGTVGAAGGLSFDECIQGSVTGCVFINNNGYNQLSLICNSGIVEYVAISGCSFDCKNLPAIGAGSDQFAARFSVSGCTSFNSPKALNLVNNNTYVSQAGNFFENLGTESDKQWVAQHTWGHYELG